MNRVFEPNPTRDLFRARFAATATPAEAPSAHRLPPTRAARPLRSRGVFLGGRWRSGLGGRVCNALCIAAAALAIAASAHFAEPAFDATVITGNAGPGLLASATRAPAFLITHAR